MGPPIIFWPRYIDDIFVVADPHDLDSILDMANSTCLPINFTIEYESVGQLKFLDILVHRELGSPFQKVSASVYRKKSFSGQYTNFSSNGPLVYKTSIIKTLAFVSFEVLW